MIFDNARFGEGVVNEVIIRDVYRLRELVGRPVTKIFDIGANYGTFSIFARMLFPDAQIFAFEPNPSTYEGLKLNTAFLRINLYQVALGNGEPVKIVENPYNQVSGATKVEVGEGAAIPSAYLPELLALTGQVVDDQTILKIDCEGAERVLIDDQRAEPILSRCLHLGLEVHHGERGFYESYPVSAWERWFQELSGRHPQRQQSAVFNTLVDQQGNHSRCEEFAMFYSTIR